jgi:hypothetical protein
LTESLSLMPAKGLVRFSKPHCSLATTKMLLIEFKSRRIVELLIGFFRHFSFCRAKT